MITVILADDHPTTRAGIHTIIGNDPNINIVGEAENGFEAMELVDRFRPKILLLDLKMPGPRPFEVEKWVRVNCPETITLVLTAHDRDAYLSEMLETGVSGFLTKNESAERLIEAIHLAAEGCNLFTDEQYRRVFKWREMIGQKIESLTIREIEIIQLLSEGLDNARMAKFLNVTQKTIAHHLTNIYEKLQVNSRSEAIVWIHKHLSERLEKISMK
jgi:two-component system response regulator DegU